MELKGRAILKNLNLRVEHHGEDLALGVDFRFNLKTSADDLVQLDPALRGALYLEDGRLRIPTLEPIKLTNEFDNHALHLGAETYEPTKLSKFEVQPEQSGQVQLTFNAAVSNFDHERLPEAVANMLEPGRLVNINIAALQGELFDGTEDGNEGE